jgi:coenzyme F420-dependent glucose-6-phosphate dehydrogenase
MDDHRLTVGYWLSSEEHSPGDLMESAVAAEESGFTAAIISDHYHPWVPEQGNSPFVWAVLGGIARTTQRLRVGTGVTAPILRMHPAVVAHAAATVAAMMPGRFFLGVGTGERLNEHVTGARWPTTPERREMLAEAIELIRQLFTGDEVDRRGRYFRVEHAQMYTLPPQPPPIVVAASGRRSAELAGRVGDGMIGVAPDAHIVDAFEAAGGRGKPRMGQLHVCWAETEEEARKTALHWWPNVGIRGGAWNELARPKDFAALSALVDEETVSSTVVTGPDPHRHLDAIARFAAAGFSEVYVHQIGPRQQDFLRFYADEVLPRLSTARQESS